MGGVRQTRRAVFKCALAAFGSLLAPAADLVDRSDEGHWEVIDRRELTGGGVGLFIAISPVADQGQLRILGQRLTAEFEDASNVIVEIFDDAQAARIVRKGSRVVGEEQFAEALRHQVATYQKDFNASRHVLRILAQPQQIIEY